MQITPTLDHYFSRSITGVGLNENNQWWIELEGGKRIINDDPNISAVPLSSGVGFWGVDWVGGILQFGVRDINGNVVSTIDQPFNQTKYRLLDPDFQSDAFVPVTQDDFDPGTPPEPTDRVADGPEVELASELHGDGPIETEGDNADQGKTKTTRRGTR